MIDSSQTNKSLSTTQILSDALKLPIKNSILFLLILLISSLSTFLTAIYLPSNPLVADLLPTFSTITSLEPTSPDYASLLSTTINNLQQLASSDSILRVLSFVLSSLISIATIHALSLSYSGKTSNIIKDFPCKLVCRLKGPMVTSVCVAVLNLGYSVVLVSTVGFFMLVAHGSKFLIALTAIVAVLGLIFYLYLTVVWSVSVVVSVVEDGCYGVEAIVKTTRTVRWRWPQGASLILIMSVMTILVSMVCERVGVHFVAYIVATVALSIYERAISVVFYFDCKRIKGEEEMASAQDEEELP